MNQIVNVFNIKAYNTMFQYYSWNNWNLKLKWIVKPAFLGKWQMTISNLIMTSYAHITRIIRYLNLKMIKTKTILNLDQIFPSIHVLISRILTGVSSSSTSKSIHNILYITTIATFVLKTCAASYQFHFFWDSLSYQLVSSNWLVTGLNMLLNILLHYQWLSSRKI